MTFLPIATRWMDNDVTDTSTTSPTTATSTRRRTMYLIRGGRSSTSTRPRHRRGRRVGVHVPRAARVPGRGARRGPRRRAAQSIRRVRHRRLPRGERDARAPAGRSRTSSWTGRRARPWRSPRRFEARSCASRCDVDAWDGRVFRASGLFAAIAGAAARIEGFARGPSPRTSTRSSRRTRACRFERAAPRPRRARAEGAPGYDARITLEGTVPTRARSWHDLMNALVWARFPNAKRALHARQHRMIAARAGESPVARGARTKEQDAVAMLDEGGVAIVHATDAREDVARAIAAPDGDVAATWRRGARASSCWVTRSTRGSRAAGPRCSARRSRWPRARAARTRARWSTRASRSSSRRARQYTRAGLGSVRVDEALARA